MKIYMNWKRNEPDTQGYSLTITYTYCSHDQGEIDDLAKKLPKGLIIMDTEKKGEDTCTITTY